MIKKLEINNFKSFEQAELELNNFTLLAGKNSMGKTSVIQAIFAMIQNGNNPFRGEYMNIGKTDFFRKCTACLIILLCFPGEAHDEIGGKTGGLKVSSQ